MPTEITITAYKYSELEGRAKERAREKLTEWHTSHEWWDCVYDDAKEKGSEKGFDIDDIRFSGFWSQGDGAHWTGRIHLGDFIKCNLDERSPWYGEDVILLELIDDGWIDRYISVENRNFRYCHSNGMQLGDHPSNALDNLDDDDNAVLAQGVMAGANVVQLRNSFDWEQRLNEWCDEAKQQARDFADEIYKQLEQEYDSLVTDEALSDFADANEYLFDEEGRMV